MNTILSKINALPTLEVEFVHGLIEDAVSLEKVREIIKDDTAQMYKDLQYHLNWLKELRDNGHTIVDLDTIIASVNNIFNRSDYQDKSTDFTFHFKHTNDTYMTYKSDNPSVKSIQVIFFKESGKYYTTEDFLYHDVISSDNSKKTYKLMTQAEEFVRDYQKTHYKGMNAVIIFESDSEGYPLMIPAAKEDD